MSHLWCHHAWLYDSYTHNVCLISFSRNCAKVRKTECNQHLISSEGNQHAKIQAIPHMCSPENPWKSQICPIWRNQNCVEMKKIDRPFSKSNQFWRWSGCISILNFRQYLLCVLHKSACKLWISPISEVRTVPKRGKSTNYQNLISSENGQDISAYQISGHSYHAFSRKWLDIFSGWMDRWSVSQLVTRVVAAQTVNILFSVYFRWTGRLNILQ